MSCKNCPDPVQGETHQSGFRYRFVGEGHTVIGLRGKLYSIREPLVKPPQKPRGGWGVVIKMHGQDHHIEGSNPFLVALRMSDFLEINEYKFTINDLWLNLNLQWLERAVEKYQHVTYNDLIKLAEPNY